MPIVSAARQAFWAGLLWTALMSAAHSTTPSAALVSVADGPPFTLIRGARLFAAARGVTLNPGDIIETEPGNLLIIEFRAGSQPTAEVAVGPASQVYWLERADHLTLAVRAGWIKVDTLSAAQRTPLEAQGLRLAASSAGGIYVLHVGAVADEIFDEQGPALLHDRRTRGDQSASAAKPSQLTRCADSGALRSQIGVDDAFVASMPAAFRDPLPTGMSARLPGRSEPQLIREVTFNDVAEWLSAPRSWRQGFIVRFRSRLSDSAFSRPLDATMSSHPEWQPVLHPPPPP